MSGEYACHVSRLRLLDSPRVEALPVDRSKSFMSRFFIARPIFACVLALLVVAFGVLAIQRMPVERYPDIAPPSVSISATYSGATAQTVENSVTQVLEQQIQGIDHLHY